MYEDPICPYCAQANRALDDTLTQLLQAGQINLKVHFVNFLDGSSSDLYSSRVTNGLYMIAGHGVESETIWTFITKLYSSDFMPEEGNNYQPVSNERLAQLAQEAGVPTALAQQAFPSDHTVKYQQYIDIATSQAQADETIRPEGQDGFSTPTMLINGKPWDANRLDPSGTMRERMLLASIGLGQKDLGKSDRLPSIGNDEHSLL